MAQQNMPRDAPGVPRKIEVLIIADMIKTSAINLRTIEAEDVTEVQEGKICRADLKDGI